MTGTIVNVAAIVAGGSIGLMVRSRLPERYTNIVFQGLGLVTAAIGISMSLKTGNLILAVVSIVAGALIGEAARMEEGLERGADRIKALLKGHSERFTEGFVAATMLYCVGSMAILGAIEDGLGRPPQLLLTKSLMDGVASVAFASSFGVGVIFSVIPVFLFQGSITLFAAWLSQVMSEVMIADMTGVGGILLIGLSLNILGIKKISVVNMLPSLVIIVILSRFFG